MADQPENENIQVVCLYKLFILFLYLELAQEILRTILNYSVYVRKQNSSNFKIAVDETD